eukprot:gene48964-6801_t
MRAPLFAAVLCAPPAAARLSANPLGTPQELRDTTDLCVGRTERNQKCSVLLDVPAGCAGESTKCPIAFFLHGGGGHGSSFVQNGGTAVHAASFIGVYPTGDEGVHHDLPFVLMSEPVSNQFWADHNGCSGPPVITNLYQVVGAGHGDAATIGGVDKLALALVFFRNVDGTPTPPTPPTPAPVPTPPAPIPDAPSAACTTCSPSECKTCLKAHQASCSSSCKPYSFAKTLGWFCGSA